MQGGFQQGGFQQQQFGGGFQQGGFGQPGMVQEEIIEQPGGFGGFGQPVVQEEVIQQPGFGGQEVIIEQQPGFQQQW